MLPSAVAGAAFSSLTDSTTASSVLAFSFSFSASAAAAFFSSSSRSLSYEDISAKMWEHKTLKAQGRTSFSCSRSLASRSFLSFSRSSRSVMTQAAAPSAAASGRDLFLRRSRMADNNCQQAVTVRQRTTSQSTT